MAEALDPVCQLSEKLEQLSAAPPDLYRLEKVPGKGIGCIANQVIEKGTLVLREVPQISDSVPTIENIKQYIADVLKAFKEMSPEDKEA